VCSLKGGPATGLPHFFLEIGLATAAECRLRGWVAVAVAYIPDVVALESFLREAERYDREAVVLLLAEKDAGLVNDVVAVLSRRAVSAAGVVVPGLIHEGRVRRRGLLGVRLPVVAAPLLVRGDGDSRREAALLELNERIGEGGTLLILVDGQWDGISEFLLELSGLLGDRVTYVGGGAGYSDAVQRPCVFSAAGIYTDAVWLVPVRWHCRLGIRHGFERVGPLLVATQTSGSRIREINWCNAFEVYRDVVAEYCGTVVDPDNFSRVAPYHPFGIVRENGEELVQDPVALADDLSIRCLGLIPENSPVSIMRGDPEGMVAAARDAGRALGGVPEDRPRLGLVIDCISRFLLLGARFSEELDAILQGNLSGGCGLEVAGFLSVGEIGSGGEGWVDFHNKTVVAGVLYEP